jgi:hypothetical protein
LGDGGVIVAAPMPMPIEFNSPLHTEWKFRVEVEVRKLEEGETGGGREETTLQAVACFEIVMHLVLLISCKKN